ncbi:MAG: hypothetical protein ABI644_11025 [Arenimonas sp.]
MKTRIMWLKSLLVLMLLPWAIVVFACLGGIDAMGFLASKFFCEPKLQNCNPHVLGATDFIIAYWWLMVGAIYTLGIFLVQITALFDSGVSLRKKLAWSVGIYLFGILVAPIYCILRLRELQTPYVSLAAA